MPKYHENLGLENRSGTQRLMDYWQDFVRGTAIILTNAFLSLRGFFEKALQDPIWIFEYTDVLILIMIIIGFFEIS